MSGSVAPIFALHLYGDIQLSLNWIMLAVVAITWISGLDYIIVGWPKLRAKKDFNRADAVRLLGSAKCRRLRWRRRIWSESRV